MIILSEDTEQILVEYMNDSQYASLIEICFLSFKAIEVLTTYLQNVYRCNLTGTEFSVSHTFPVAYLKRKFLFLFY